MLGAGYPGVLLFILLTQPVLHCRQVALEFALFVQRCCIGGKVPVLVAHNGVGFDFPFLVLEFRRTGLELPLDWQYLDTVLLARHFRTTGSNALVSRPGHLTQDRHCWGADLRWCISPLDKQVLQSEGGPSMVPWDLSIVCMRSAYQCSAKAPPARAVGHGLLAQSPPLERSSSLAPA